MAEVVNTNDDFTEETLKPFEVEMTDMLTVPLTTIAQDEHRGGIWEIGRNAKDWVAEQVNLYGAVTKLKTLPRWSIMC
jgi:hypothetical protein